MQPGVEDERVEAVVLRLAVPQRRDRGLELGPGRRRVGGDRPVPRALQAEVIDPERPVELVRVLVHDLQPHVLKLRQDSGKRNRLGRPVDAQPRLALGEGHGQPEGLPVRFQAGHLGKVGHRCGWRHVCLVVLRNADAGQLGDLRRLLAAEAPLGFCRKVLVPGTDGRRHLGLDPGGLSIVHGGDQATRPGLHHDVQPGERGAADPGAVVDRAAVERGPQDLLGAQPDLRGVPVPGQVHQAGHVASVSIRPQEQPDLLALAKSQYAQRDRGQLLGRDLEQILERVVLQDLDELLAVVAFSGEPGRVEHLGELVPQHRDLGDGLGVGGLRIQAEEPVLADHLAVGGKFAHRHVVQVRGPVDGGPDRGLGQHEPLGCVLLLHAGRGRQVRVGAVMP